jgi:large subunit ribosomal protein L23
MNTSSKSLLDLIKYPILTEKTSRLIEQNQYSFAVDKKADKISIKRAIEYLFDVKVTSVNTANSPLKKRRVGKFIGKKTQNKRVIVTLAPENSITFFENA